MKQYSFIFFTLFICSARHAYAQVKDFTAKGIEQVMVKATDSLYACQYETTNAEYNQFLADVARKDSALYLQYCVDSVKWLLPEYYNEPLVKYYHCRHGFNNYPVVCISYEGAVAYCNWLTDIYNSDPKRGFRKVVFVLPSEAEWELAAMGTSKMAVYPWGTNSMRDTRKGSWQGMFLANYKRVGDGTTISDKDGKPVFKENPEVETHSSNLNDRAFHTSPVNSFFPNSLGIYNQGGNVAEMTSQKGLTKGGSWNSLGGELRIKYKLFFYEPSPEVGFRVFMKIVEK